MKSKTKIVSLFLTAVMAASAFAVSASAEQPKNVSSTGSDSEYIKKSITVCLDKGDELELDTYVDYDAAPVCGFQVEAYCDASDLAFEGETTNPSFGDALINQTKDGDKLFAATNMMSGRDTLDLSNNSSLLNSKYVALKDCKTTIDIYVSQVYVTVNVNIDGKDVEDISSVLNDVNSDIGFKINNHPIGDVNGDNAVNVADAISVQKHVVKINQLSGSKFTLGDANKDGNISVSDAILIQKSLVGIVDLK